MPANLLIHEEISAPQSPERWFFALLPDEPLRAAIEVQARALRQSQHAAGRALNPQRYHLTLRYLGQYSAAPAWLEPAARAAAAQVRVSEFVWALDRAGSFEKSRVWWLGVDQLSPALAEMREALDRELLATGAPWPADRDGFHPHVTVQREVRVPMAAPITPLSWRVREFVLIRSRPQQPYEVITRWPCRGAESTTPEWSAHPGARN